MKQWLLERFGSPRKAPRIQEVGLPAPLPNHIAIKIKAVPNCFYHHRDTSAARGQRPQSTGFGPWWKTSARRLLIAEQVALAKMGQWSGG